MCARRASARGEDSRRALASRSGTSSSSGSPAKGIPGSTCAWRPSARSPTASSAPDLAREGLRLLSRAQALALVEQACAEFLTAKSYFGQLRDRPGFHRALQRTFDEIRAAGLSPAALPAEAFEDKRKLKELKGILARYDADLAKGRFVDSAAGPAARSGGRETRAPDRRGI